MPQVGNIEIHSNEMEEVIGNIPSWVVRWGIAVLFGITVLFLFISNFIKYPDALTGKAIILTKEQPEKITVGKTNAGQYFKVYVKEGDTVKQGDTLLVAQNEKTGKVSPAIASLAGKIFISKDIDENNALTQSIWIVPPPSKFQVKIKYGNKDAGDVKVGKTVKIVLADFPESEYGYLEGQISSIMPIQIDGEHQAYISLNTDKLITSQKKEIPISPIMEGHAEIFLNDKTIFKRIFNSLF